MSGLTKDHSVATALHEVDTGPAARRGGRSSAAVAPVTADLLTASPSVDAVRSVTLESIRLRARRVAEVRWASPFNVEVDCSSYLIV
ncbi:MAG: hypothetical protein HIU84_06860 [Acidobacteria bacterium]|nr:hypothetical protein [Acidobacteriota bacterium]